MKKRDSNIELLRILAMVFIVMHHFSIRGGFLYENPEVSVNRVFLQFLLLGGKIGVDVFVLISGYFLVCSSSIKIKKLLHLWLQIFTFSFLILLVDVFFGGVDFKTLMQHILPVTFENWWFASTYFALYLLSPYLNKLIHTLSKNELRNLILLLAGLWVVIPTLLTKKFQSNNLLFFIFLYLIASYIRLYFEDFKWKKGKYLFLSAVLAFLTFMSAVFFDIVGLKFPILSHHATHFFSQNQIPIVLISISIFIGFLKLDLGHRKVINSISSATFGVYLIHEDPILRNWLWHQLFRNSDFQNSPYLIPYAIMAIILVYIVCTAIELIRQNTIQKLYTPFVNRSGDWIQEKMENRMK